MLLVFVCRVCLCMLWFAVNVRRELPVACCLLLFLLVLCGWLVVGGCLLCVVRFACCAYLVYAVVVRCALLFEVRYV